MEELSEREQRKRIVGKLEPFIMAFREERLTSTFHAEELRDYVIAKSAYYVAPDSPGRALRELRQMGKLNYVVIDRTKSLYQFRGASE